MHEIFWQATTAGIEGHDDLPVDFGMRSIGMGVLRKNPIRDEITYHRRHIDYCNQAASAHRYSWTLADWVGASTELLAPLNDALGQYVMSASKLHADDTPVPVLAPGTGKTKLGRLWTYVRDDRPAGMSPAVDCPAVKFCW